MGVKRATRNSSDPAEAVTKSCPIEQKAIVAIAGLLRASGSRFYGETQLDAVKTAAFLLIHFSLSCAGRSFARWVARAG